MSWRHVHVYHIQLRQTDDITVRHVLMYKTSQRVQSLSLYTVLNFCASAKKSCNIAPVSVDTQHVCV